MSRRLTSRRVARRFIALLIIACMTLAGCAARDPMGERTPSIGTPQPVVPDPSSQGEGWFYANMYYQYLDQPYLAWEMRPCDVDDIATVVRAWMEGPQQNTSLNPVLSPAATLISATLIDRQAVVTFSGEFYQTMPDTPSTWRNSDVWRDRVNLQRRLCLYALVNTLTESGLCSSVQITVVDARTGTYEHPLMEDVGFMEREGELLDILRRDTSLVLTPYNVLDIVLSAASRNDAAALYPFLALRDAKGVMRPAQNDVDAMLRSANTLIIAAESDAKTDVIWQDGKTVTTSINLTLQTKSGEQITYLIQPVRLIKENGIWKVELSMLMSLLNQS